MSIAERFWIKVDKRGPNDCWGWLASKNPDGYGCFFMSGGPQGAHRISWLINKGKIPLGMCVLHTCDNPACVNPNHLWIGTHTENMKDMAIKGRNKWTDHTGELNPLAKLNDSDVLRIRQLIGQKSYMEIAKIFDVSKSLIGQIAIRQIWQHI